jgi:hypothetical protein
MTEDTVLLALTGLALMASLFFAYRTLQSWREGPDCSELATVHGVARDVDFHRPFYGGWRLDFALQGQPLRVPASPFVWRAAGAASSGVTLEARFCAAAPHERARVWELVSDSRSLFTIGMLRAHWRDQARVALGGVLLSLGAALYLWLTYRVGRQPNS